MKTISMHASGKTRWAYPPEPTITRPLLLLEDARTLLQKRKLCPNDLCPERGSPQVFAPILRPSFHSTDVWKREFPMSERPDGSVNLGRHRRNCKICAHQRRDEIEREFINWTGVKAIARNLALRIGPQFTVRGRLWPLLHGEVDARLNAQGQGSIELST